MSRDTCPYCSGAETRPGPVTARARYRVCASCGSAFIAEGLMDFREYYGGYDPEAVRTLPQTVHKRYEALLADLETRCNGRRLLEIGCGNGLFLAQARARGWQVCGTELSGPHVARARAQGLEVVQCESLRDASFEGGPFHTAVAIEVVEHVPDPAGLLRAMAERLVPGGWVYLTTPNFGSLTRRIVGDQWSVLDAEHVALATPAGLRIALRAAGMETVRVRTKHAFVSEWKYRFRPRRVSDAHRNDAVAELRDRIEGSRTLRGVKATVNTVLGVMGLGDAMECFARRKSAP